MKGVEFDPVKMRCTNMKQITIDDLKIGQPVGAIWRSCGTEKDTFKLVVSKVSKYSLQGTTQGNGLTGGVPPVRFSM